VGWLYDMFGRRQRRVGAWIFTAVRSRHRFVYPVLQETTATAIEACEAAWEYFGGVFKAVIPDNTKTIVNEADPLDAKLVLDFLEYAQSSGGPEQRDVNRLVAVAVYAELPAALVGHGGRRVELGLRGDEDAPVVWAADVRLRQAGRPLGDRAVADHLHSPHAHPLVAQARPHARREDAVQVGRVDMAVDAECASSPSSRAS
jgi:hypothetical protein